MRIGYLGPKTNSELAVGMLKGAFEHVRLPSIDEVVKTLYRGGVDRAVIPVRNSITGAITDHLDMITQYGLSVVDEISIPIRHCIAGMSRDVGFIMSHPEALKQCSTYLDKHFPYTYRGAVNSTAWAAEFISHIRGNGAAIAREDTCRHYGLPILEKDIVRNNISSFYVCEKDRVKNHRGIL